MSEALDEQDARARPRLARGHKAKVTSLKKTRPKSRVTEEVPDSAWKGVGLGVLLIALCVGLGVQISSQSQRMRALYSELQKDQVIQDALLAQHSRLLIERGALSSYHGAERLASEKLGMRFPETITRVYESDGRLSASSRKMH